MSTEKEGQCPKCPACYSTKEELTPHIFWSHEQPKYTQSQLDQALATLRAELAEGVRGLTPIRIVNVDFDLLSKGEVLQFIEGSKG